MDWLQEYGEIAIVAIMIIIVIQFLMIILISNKLKKLRRSYLAMMQTTSVDDLEQVLGDIRAEQRRQNDEAIQLAEQVKKIQTHLPTMKSNVTIRRYNAFSDMGSDLSFSMAILNDNKDGVVITSIHSRDGGYVYAKPVEKGESSYSLTPEEQKVIDDVKTNK